MSNQLTTNFDTSKIFIWDNQYQPERITNNSYDEASLPQGTVMARLAGSTEIVPFDSSDPKQLPLGVLTQDLTVAGGETASVYICIAGGVVESKLYFVNGTDTVNTTLLPGGQTIKDYLQANNTGIKLVPSTELTSYDNQ